jgi:sporulation protein YlmC with PRC-barrel domain
MKRPIKAAVGALACCGVMGWSAASYAVDATTSNAHTYRSSKLVGMHVRNNEGEKIGTVDDLVIDMNTGKISYVALGFGGVLGLGEKLFAVPFSQMKVERTSDESYFVLNVSKERLMEAPGFDKSHWPDLADPNWASHIDKYYRTETKSVTTSSTR